MGRKNEYTVETAKGGKPQTVFSGSKDEAVKVMDRSSDIAVVRNSTGRIVSTNLRRSC